MKRFAIPLLAVLLMTTVVVLSLNNQSSYQSDLNASSDQIARLEREEAQSSSLEETSSSELPDQEASNSEQVSTASQESAAPSLAESSSSQSVREQQSSAAQQPSEQQKVTSSSSAKPEQRPAKPAPSSSAPVPSVPSAPESSRPSSSKPEADSNSLSYAQRVVQLVNQEREKAGLQPLSISRSAEAAALIRSKEIENSFSHTRPNGSSFSTALKEQGVSYRSSGENIAWGQKTPEQVMQGWMNSPGHRANILNANFTAIGVGYYRNAAGVNYWTQLFIG